MSKDGKYSYKMTQLTQSIWIACINVEFGMWLLFKVTPYFHGGPGDNLSGIV